MDVLDEELVKFWKTLNENRVRYIMVGGFATRFHGFNRSTDDLDMWLEDTRFGDFTSLETMQFVPGWTNFYVGAGIELDIMTSMKGLESIPFNECLDVASVAELEGVQVPFLHINHLIANKRIVNRPKDQLDVIELEKIRKIREEGR